MADIGLKPVYGEDDLARFAENTAKSSIVAETGGQEFIVPVE